MKCFGKVLTIATLAVGFGLMTAPNASACGFNSVLTQPAVINTGVVDTSLMQPAVVGAPIVDTSLMQPAVIDNSCGTCGTTLMQPAVIDNSCALPACAIPVRRHHLLGLDTPFFGFHLF